MINNNVMNKQEKVELVVGGLMIVALAMTLNFLCWIFY